MNSLDLPVDKLPIGSHGGVMPESLIVTRFQSAIGTVPVWTWGGWISKRPHRYLQEALCLL